MNADSINLDLCRLEKIRQSGGKVTARCPACAEHGGDRTGNHLTIFPSGKFACAATPGDVQHRRRIFALVGLVRAQERDPAQDRQWRQQRAEEQDGEQERRQLIETIKTKRDAIIKRHRWDRADVWENSPQKIDCQLVESDPRWFLASLFPESATVWTGEVHESGQEGIHSSRWRTVEEWQDEPQVGPMTTPALWKPGTLSRAAGNVAAAPYVVLDFDGLDGRKPKTAEEIEVHLRASLAMIRWIREGLHWQLAAILLTGSVSLHAWFHSPPQDVLESLKTTATTLGMDAGLIDHPEHPCRLPGHRHQRTGNPSRILWLQNPL